MINEQSKYLGNFLKILGTKNVAELSKIEKVIETKLGQCSISLYGNVNKDEQLNDQDLDEFFSPIANAVLKAISDNLISVNDLYQVIVVKDAVRYYMIVKTTQTIFKFTVASDDDNPENLVNYIDAVKAVNLKQFLFSGDYDDSFQVMLKNVIDNLNDQETCDRSIL